MSKGIDPAAHHLQGKTPLSYMSERKHLRKQAEREYPDQRTAWYGGRLYFLDQQGTPIDLVPGVKEVAKPMTRVVGKEGSAPPYAPADSRPRTAISSGTIERVRDPKYGDVLCVCKTLKEVPARPHTTTCANCGINIRVAIF